MSTIINGIKYNDAMTRIFDGYKAVGDIVIPNGVISIENGAFRHSEIRSVIFPDSLKFIDSSAFKYCSCLERVVFGRGMHAISEDTFCGCRNLKKVKIPDSIEDIWNMAFAGCIRLSDVTLGKSLRHIGTAAFYDTAIEKITIPSSVNYLASSCFFSNNLKEVVFQNFKPYDIDAFTTFVCDRPDRNEWPKESDIIKLICGDNIRYIPKFRYENSPDTIIPSYTLADSDTLQYATAIKEYECTKDGEIKEFLMKHSVDIARVILKAGREEAFIKFLNLNIIPENVIPEILSITTELNSPVAAAYLLQNSKNLHINNKFDL